MDREKVIKDLEECLSASCRGFRPRLLCPYNDEEWNIMRDALALLKEQDAVEPKSHPAKAWTRAKTLWFCGACGARISKRKTKYCQECGTAVKWT